MNNLILEDRYSATGTPYPDKDSCRECDAMGVYPIRQEDLNEEACKYRELIIIGQKDGDAPMKHDGWFIVRCPVCKGARKSTIPEKEESNE